MAADRSAVLGAMGVREFSLRRPSLLPRASRELLYADVLRSFPYFSFVGDDALNRDWVFNLVGYLRYISYPCGWYGRGAETGERTLTVCPASRGALPDGSAPDIPVYPGIAGKRNVWGVIKKYVSEVDRLKIPRPKTERPLFILESPEKCKWIYNFAGYLDYNGISYSWDPGEAAERSVSVIFAEEEGDRVVRISGDGEAEQKRNVFARLVGDSFLAVSGAGAVPGARFGNDNQAGGAG